MDKLDLKVYRTMIERNSGLHREEMLKIIGECQRLQEREAAQDAIIEMSAATLQRLRNTLMGAIPPGDVVQLFNEVRRLSKIVAERNAELIAEREHRDRVVDDLGICRDSHSDALKCISALKRELKDAAAPAPPAPVEGCKLTAEQIGKIKELHMPGERWFSAASGGGTDLYLMVPDSDKITRVGVCFERNNLAESIVRVLNALPDLLHDIVVLRSEVEHLRRRAVAAELKQAEEYQRGKEPRR